MRLPLVADRVFFDTFGRPGYDRCPGVYGEGCPGRPVFKSCQGVASYWMCSSKSCSIRWCIGMVASRPFPLPALVAGLWIGIAPQKTAASDPCGGRCCALARRYYPPERLTAPDLCCCLRPADQPVRFCVRPAPGAELAVFNRGGVAAVLSRQGIDVGALLRRSGQAVPVLRCSPPGHFATRAEAAAAAQSDELVLPLSDYLPVQAALRKRTDWWWAQEPEGPAGQRSPAPLIQARHEIPDPTRLAFLRPPQRAGSQEVEQR